MTPDTPMTDRGLARQPAPRPGMSREVADFAMELLEARIVGGEAAYGTPLTVGNGRDHLADALQEQLDGVQYLAAAWLHRERYGAVFRFALGDRVRWARDLPEREDCRHWVEGPYRVVRRRLEDWMADEGHCGCRRTVRCYAIARADGPWESATIPVYEADLAPWEEPRA